MMSLHKIKILSIIYILVLFFLFPLESYSNLEPWDEYSKYIKTPVSKKEVRGIWIASVVNLDWPSKKTSENIFK